MLKNKGLFIGLSGMEASGKTTTAKLLYEHYKDKYNVILTREPGGINVVPIIRTLLKDAQYPLEPLTEFFLFLADRSEHMKKLVIPAINDGNIVICDRTAYCTFAYQLFGRGIGIPYIHDYERICKYSMHGYHYDIVFYLNCGWEEMKKRIISRGILQNDRFDNETEEFFINVKKGYDWYVAKEEMREINSNQNEQIVTSDIINMIDELIERKNIICESA